MMYQDPSKKNLRVYLHIYKSYMYTTHIYVHSLSYSCFDFLLFIYLYFFHHQAWTQKLILPFLPPAVKTSPVDQVRAATAQFLVQRVWDGAPVALIFVACHLFAPRSEMES